MSVTVMPIIYADVTLLDKNREIRISIQVYMLENVIQFARCEGENGSTKNIYAMYLVRKTLERMHVIQQKAFQSLRVVKLGFLDLLK